MVASSSGGTGSAQCSREFRVVLAGQAVSALGDAITLTVTPLLVLQLTGSGAWMGAVGALQFLPDLLLSLVAGVIADRFDRRRLVMGADIGRAVLTALIPLAHWSDLSTLGVLVAVIFPINALRVVSDAGLSSALPQLVGREHLERANGVMEATLSVPYIVGPAIAGVLIAWIGAPSTLTIDAATFGLSAASFLAVHRTLRADRPAEMPSWWRDMSDGLQFIRHHVTVRTVIGFWALIALVTTPLVATLSYYVTIDRGRSASVFGLLGSAWSLGYLGGSLVVSRLANRGLGARLVLAGVTIGGLVLAIAATGAVAVHCVAVAGVGAALAVIVVTASTLRATLTPDELLGRVGATSRTLSLGLQPVAMVAAGVVIETAGGQGALLVLGSAAIAGSLLFLPGRSFRNASYPTRGAPVPI